MSIKTSKEYKDYKLDDYVAWFKIFSIENHDSKELYIIIDTRYLLSFYKDISDVNFDNNVFMIIIQDFYDLINNNIGLDKDKKEIISTLLGKKIYSLIKTFKPHFYLNPILRIKVKSEVERYLKSLGGKDEIQ